LSLLAEMELTHADCDLLLERLAGVHGNKAHRLREKLEFLRDRTVDVIDTEAKVWAAYADRELNEDEARAKIAALKEAR
jgi:hypothetical protein